jgi:hypothetical protein
MKETFDVKIIDITGKEEYHKYLCKSLAPMPFRKCKYGQEYLEKVVPIGLQKLVIVNKTVVGTT